MSALKIALVYVTIVLVVGSICVFAHAGTWQETQKAAQELGYSVDYLNFLTETQWASESMQATVPTRLKHGYVVKLPKPRTSADDEEIRTRLKELKKTREKRIEAGFEGLSEPDRNVKARLKWMLNYPNYRLKQVFPEELGDIILKKEAIAAKKAGKDLTQNQKQLLLKGEKLTPLEKQKLRYFKEKFEPQFIPCLPEDEVITK